MDFVYYVLAGLKAYIEQETTITPGQVIAGDDGFAALQPKIILIGEKLLDDPEDLNPHVKIFHDPEKGTEKLDEYDEIGETMGFGHHFVVTCRCMFTRDKFVRDEAIQVAMDLFNRVKKGILNHLDASFEGDEEAFLMQRALRKFVYKEAGGPPNEWIWDATFEISIVTQRP